MPAIELMTCVFIVDDWHVVQFGSASSATVSHYTEVIDTQNGSIKVIKAAQESISNADLSEAERSTLQSVIT